MSVNGYDIQDIAASGEPSAPGHELLKRSAVAFDNPDFVDVVIHSYRHRYALVAGDVACAAIEARVALRPSIGVPAIVLDGADDGVTPAGGRHSLARRV